MLMSAVMECLAVDWSGALTGSASRIWVARAIGGQLMSLEAPGSRVAVRDLLLARRQNAAPCLVGLDFAFGFPAWFAAAQQWTAIEQVWSAAQENGERWLAECPQPFWGRPGVRRTHLAMHGLRETERSWQSESRPKSVFQIGGAGAVGTGSIRGMPMLLELRHAGWAVWPFDAPGSHSLVEIYPRLFTGPVVKSRRESRAAHLASRDHALSADFRNLMENSEDAFDAGLAAIGLSQAVSAGAAWPGATDDARIEGQIWEPAPVDPTAPIPRLG